MANKSITKEVKTKAGALSQTEFFNRLLAKSGYLDKKQVQQVYYGLKDLIFEELKSRGVIELPDLCDIYLSMSKPRVLKNRHMDAPVLMDAHHQVRMVPKRAVKAHFKMLEAFYEGRKFDPSKRTDVN